MTSPRTLALLAVSGVALALGGAIAARAASRFEREVARLAERLEIGPGSVVADIGAGKGDFALALARRVGPGGRVYATEIDAGLRDKIARAAEREGLANLVVVEALEDATGLPPGCCDAAYLRDVYHHLTKPEPFLASLNASLRPGARFVVIDFRPTLWLAPWTPKGLPEGRSGHGIEPEVVTREVTAAGFSGAVLDEDWPGSWLHPLFAIGFDRP